MITEADGLMDLLAFDLQEAMGSGTKLEVLLPFPAGLLALLVLAGASRGTVHSKAFARSVDLDGVVALPVLGEPAGGRSGETASGDET
ncbi:hypothetical protein [Planctomycetes bacterium Poly30]